MTLSVALLAYAVVLGSLAGCGLKRADWPRRSPGLGLLAWLGAIAGLVVSSALSSVLLLLHAPAEGGLLGWFRTCFDSLAVESAAPQAMIALTAVGLLTVGLMRVITSIHVALRRARRERRRHDRAIAQLTPRPLDGPDDDVVLIDHPSGAAFCFPGRPGRIVITSRVRDLLDPEELAAVLAHERAHLRERHHLWVLLAGSLQAAFPFVPLFQQAPSEIATLVELRADDYATRVTSREIAACAVAALAGAGAPAPALGVGGVSAFGRAQRLVGQPHPVRRWFACATLGLTTLVAAGPLLTALPPLAALHAAGPCILSADAHARSTSTGLRAVR